MRIARCSVVVFALVAIGSHASAQTPMPAPAHNAGWNPYAIPADTGRDTSRLTLGAGIGIFASYPGSYEEEAPTVWASTPLWLGTRYRFFQWEANLFAFTGIGFNSRSAYVVVGPQFGFNLYLGSVFGLEFRYGVAGAAQLGQDIAAGVVFASGGGYVFRFWEDDRKRVKVTMNMQVGAFFAADPGNDLATNAGGFSLGLAYEGPL